MQDDTRTHGCHAGCCFAKWGLWFFILGVILGFTVLIHYILGSAYNNSANFLSNITLWFGSPLMFSTGFLQIGGLSMAILGALLLLASKWCGTRGLGYGGDTTAYGRGDTTATTTTADIAGRSDASLRSDVADCCRKCKTAFTLCTIGLVLLILTGFFGYYIIDYIWPGFYYQPVEAGKNLWLILQGLSVLIFIIGFILATACLCKCCRHGDHHHHSKH